MLDISENLTDAPDTTPPPTNSAADLDKICDVCGLAAQTKDPKPCESKVGNKEAQLAAEMCACWAKEKPKLDDLNIRRKVYQMCMDPNSTLCREGKAYQNSAGELPDDPLSTGKLTLYQICSSDSSQTKALPPLDHVKKDMVDKGSENFRAKSNVDTENKAYKKKWCGTEAANTTTDGNYCCGVAEPHDSTNRTHYDSNCVEIKLRTEISNTKPKDGNNSCGTCGLLMAGCVCPPNDQTPDSYQGCDGKCPATNWYNDGAFWGGAFCESTPLGNYDVGTRNKRMGVAYNWWRKHLEEAKQDITFFNINASPHPQPGTEWKISIDSSGTEMAAWSGGGKTGCTLKAEEVWLTPIQPQMTKYTAKPPEEVCKALEPLTPGPSSCCINIATAADVSGSDIIVSQSCGGDAPESTGRECDTDGIKGCSGGGICQVVDKRGKGVCHCNSASVNKSGGRSGQNCEICDITKDDCPAPHAVGDTETCKCKCDEKAGYFGNGKTCILEKKPWYKMIADWFNNLSTVNKVLVYGGIGVVVIVTIILLIILL